MDTLFTGKVVKHILETTSTNDLASQALKCGNVIEGSVFRADVQTSGKGQRGRVWQSSAGQNILASYVFYPYFLRSDEQFNLVKSVSLALKDLLDKYIIDEVTIKWPNDIYVNNSKIAGILIESTMKGNFMNSSVIGIGLNVNQREFDILSKATSIGLETGKGCDLDLLFRELSHHLEGRYLQLKRNKNSMYKEYQEALFRLNQKSDFIIHSQNCKMTIQGVDELGRIVLMKNDKSTQAYAMHEVKQVI